MKEKWRKEKKLSAHWLRLVVAISRLFSAINVILVRHTISRANERIVATACF